MLRPRLPLQQVQDKSFEKKFSKLACPVEDRARIWLLGNEEVVKAIESTKTTKSGRFQNQTKRVHWDMASDIESYIHDGNAGAVNLPMMRTMPTTEGSSNSSKLWDLRSNISSCIDDGFSTENNQQGYKDDALPELTALVPTHFPKSSASQVIKERHSEKAIGHRRTPSLATVAEIRQAIHNDIHGTLEDISRTISKVKNHNRPRSLSMSARSTYEPPTFIIKSKNGTTAVVGSSNARAKSSASTKTAKAARSLPPPVIVTSKSNVIPNVPADPKAASTSQICSSVAKMHSPRSKPGFQHMPIPSTPHVEQLPQIEPPETISLAGSSVALGLQAVAEWDTLLSPTAPFTDRIAEFPFMSGALPSVLPHADELRFTPVPPPCSEYHAPTVETVSSTSSNDGRESLRRVARVYHTPERVDGRYRTEIWGEIPVSVAVGYTVKGKM